MADYFEEMSWRPLEEGESGVRLLHFARMLYDLVHSNSTPDEWPRLPPPASKQAVSELKIEIVENEGQNCPICLKNHEVGDKIVTMPCDHIYHEECILTWLEKTNSCPMCRFELPTDDPHYEEFKKEQKRTIQREHDLEDLHNSMFL